MYVISRVFTIYGALTFNFAVPLLLREHENADTIISKLLDYEVWYLTRKKFYARRKFEVVCTMNI
jgi:hypothetical protein